MVSLKATYLIDRLDELWQQLTLTADPFEKRSRHALFQCPLPLQTKIELQPLTHIVELYRETSGDKIDPHVRREPVASKHYDATNWPCLNVFDGAGNFLFSRPLGFLKLAFDTKTSTCFVVSEYHIDASFCSPDSAPHRYLNIRFQTKLPPQRRYSIPQLIP